MDYTKADRELLAEFEQSIKNKKWSQARSFLSDEFEASESDHNNSGTQNHNKSGLQNVINHC